MNYKKFLACVLAGSMVVGSSFAVFAENQSGSTSGSGSLDIVEKSDVFSVDLPTIPESGDTTFNYILDPTGVIKATEAEKYSGATFADGKTVYFANQPATESGAVSYSDTSDALTITNKSTMDVSVTVKATVKTVDGIKMSTTDTFDADDTEAKLYLALKDKDSTNSATAITANGAELTSTINALAGAYETKYENGKYVKKLKTNPGTFNTYSFQITGACNPKGAWNGLTDNPPVIDVVWSVEDPTITGPQISMNNSGLITMTGFTEEQNYSSMIVVDGEGTEWDVTVAPYQWNGDDWNETTGGNATMQLSDQWKNFLIEKGGNVQIKLTLTDGTVIRATATIS